MIKSKQLRLKDERRKKYGENDDQKDRKAFCVARNKVSTLIHDAKTDYYRTKIINCAGDQQKIFEIINELTHRKSTPKLPSGSTEDLQKAFSDVFIQKIEKIRQIILESIPPNQDLACGPQHQSLSILEIFNPATKNY